MSENRFDKAIAERLQDLEMPYEPASWDALQAKMDQQGAPAPEADTTAFDAKIRNVLEQVEMPYHSALWDKMADKLDHAGTVQKIRRYKMAEAAAVLLLALYGTALLNGTIWFHMPRPQETPEELPAMASKATKKARQYSEGTIGSALQVPALLPTQPLAAHAPLHTGNSQHAHPANSAAIAIPIAAAYNHNNGTLNAALVDAKGQTIPKGLRPTTLLAALGLDQLQTVPQPSPAMANLLPTKTRKGKNSDNGQTYAMAYGGTDHHWYSGSDQYSTQFQSVSGGVRAGRRKGKWGAEAGVEYAPVAYQPESDIIGFYKDNGRVFATKYHQVRATMVSVPARVTRQVAHWGRTSVHAVAGATAHLATQKTYRFKDEEYLPGLPSSVPTPDAKPDQPTANGLTEGGTLYGNSYLTADAGVRLEHRLSRRTAAYVEPQYRRFVNGRGIGPNKGKSNALGIQAGVVALL